METKINVPTSLDGIKLSEYQDLIKTQSMSNDEEFIAQKMISLFCGIPLNEVVKIKLSSVNELIEHFSKLFSTKPNLQEVIVLDGVKYGFIPSLEDISYGEYIDLENSLQDWSQYHRALSVLYRPITGQVKRMYTIEDYEPSEARETVFKNAPVSVAISATVFFLSFRDRVIKDYPSLFGDGSEENERDFSSKGQFAKKWGFYSSIYAIAQGKLGDFDEVTSMGLFKCLTYLTFEKEKKEIEQQELNKLRK